ncbi:cellulose binding domain-containing protein [Planctobacterium marinum]|uniref:PKD domain-containing protein n=1 Tax=Planctobacterium marinum TaxID=1631968 RepID=A0AA48HHN2_9ALTE|nr:hypothetical protein MACH26_21120 [Planctobacterium marinum]
MLGSKKPSGIRCLLLMGIVSSSSGWAAQCEFNVENEWNSGFTSSVKITNDGEQTITGWQVGLAYSQGSTVTGAWNSSFTGSNPYTFTNASYNQTINPGSSVTFGFNSQKGTPGVNAESPILSGVCDTDSVVMAPEAVIEQDVVEGQIPLTVTFNGASSVSQNSEISQWHWNFGDGQSGSGAETSHTYESAGSYQVQLTVVDDNGESSPASVTIVATEPEPENGMCEFFVEHEWNSGFTGKVRITNQSPNTANSWTVIMAFSDNTMVTGTWNSAYTGNNPYTISNASYNSTISPGNFVEFGFNAQKDNNQGDVTIPSLSGFCDGVAPPPNTPPVAIVSVSETSGNAPLTVNFSGSDSSDADNDPITFNWTFGDGGTATTSEATHIFTEPGDYQVQLTVSDGNSESLAEVIDIRVFDTMTGEPQDYQLDSANSALWFVSTKKLHTLESHTFTEIAGELTTQGDASLRISLDSVDTGIATRDQRMREHLFDTATFSETEVLLSFDAEQISAMAVGTSEFLTVEALLNMHGLSVAVSASLRVSKLNSGSLLVVNTQPIIINATDFNLDAGIETLKELAGLASISYAVPVNFHLLFQPQAAQE